MKTNFSPTSFTELVGGKMAENEVDYSYEEVREMKSNDTYVEKIPPTLLWKITSREYKNNFQQIN